MSDSEDLVEMPEDGDDLFGESDVGEVLPGSDKGGASDDEAGDRTRAYGDYGDDDDQADQGGAFHEERVIESVEVHRHRIPKPKDGMLRSFRVPKFMRVLPVLYDRDTFEPTDQDVANAKSENPKAEVRVRKDAVTGHLQGNTMIHRWSDGSVTISVGDQHFEVNTKSLAPPADKPYQELQDAHYYAAAADLNSNHYMMVGHIQEQYSVRPGKDVEDDALAKLAERMQAASRGGHEGDMIIKTMHDPEQRKREAEQAEKERMKAQRRRETQAAKMDGAQRYPRGGAGAGAGLSIADLEGGRRTGGSRKRAAGGGKPKRRRPEYDSDDDLPSGARRAGDDYDLQDDFIAPSDDENSDEVEEEEEEEEELDDEDELPRRKRQRTVDAEDADADGDDDDEDTGHGRSRQRRQVIDDDDDEDED